MTWMIVILFATFAGDVYIFTDPVFETREECMTYIQDRDKIPGLVQKLYSEYGQNMPIQAVNCLEKQTIEDILKGIERVSA
jgi:hypothetical protein